VTRLPPLLRLVNPVAERALVVGDPGRALELAQALLERPLMSNHQRGLWGYTGTASDGRSLTIQSTGTGGPSAVAVLGELAAAGVRTVVRVGSAVAVDPRIDRAAVHVVARAEGADGTSRALGAERSVLPDRLLLERLTASGAPVVRMRSVDLLPQDGGPALPALPDGDAGEAGEPLALDRQSAAILAAARRLGVAAAAVVAFPDPDEDEAARTAWWRAAGLLAARGLGVAAPAPSAD